MKKRIESIQILRALAFLEIFLGHCGVECFSGSFGVSIFMIMSGFCMAINALPRISEQGEDAKCPTLAGSVKSGISKVKKLYGLHLVMLAVTYVVVGMPTSGKALKRLVIDILLLKCWKFHSEDYYSYNGVAWYLSTYLFVCMMAPYVLYLVGKIKKKIHAAGIAAIIYVLMVAMGAYVSAVTIPLGDGFAKWLTYLCPFYRILDFSLGVLLGWGFVFAAKTGEEKKVNTATFANGKWTLLELLTLTLVVVFEGIYPQFKAAYMGLGYTAFWIPVSLLLVLVFAKNQGLITKSLNCRSLLWLGNISSLTFLIHQIVIRGLKMNLPREAFGDWYLPVIILSSGLITLLGAMFYQWIQKKTPRF